MARCKKEWRIKVVGTLGMANPGELFFGALRDLLGYPEQPRILPPKLSMSWDSISQNWLIIAGEDGSEADR